MAGQEQIQHSELDANGSAAAVRGNSGGQSGVHELAKTTIYELAETNSIREGSTRLNISDRWY